MLFSSGEVMPNNIMKTTPKEIKIAKTFNSLKEAVLSSGISLEYNEGLALQNIKSIEEDDEFGEAYLTEEGEVYYTYYCDIRLLNKYEPFHACLHNGDFHLLKVADGIIKWIDLFTIPNTPQGRKEIAGIPAKDVFAHS